MKGPFVVLALFCAAFVGAQDSSKPITYTAKAVPLLVVLDEISKQGGVKLKTASDMEEEPLILRLDNVPLKDVMDKMADVFAADWVDHGDYKRLERSDEKIAAIRANAFQAKVKAIADSIADLVQLEGTNGPLDKARADELVQEAKRFDTIHKNDTMMQPDKVQFVMNSKMPSTRMGVRLLALMDPAQMAALKDGEEVVFSTSPNGMQKQMPEIDPKIIDDFIADRQTFHDAATRANVKFEGMMTSYLQDETVVPTGKPARLIAQLADYGPAIQVIFTIFDEKGNMLGQDGEGVGRSWEERFATRQKNNQLAVEAARSGFELSPVALEIYTHSQHAASEMRPLSEETTKAILSPTTTDPLAIATSDTILKGSELEKLNAIALVPDDAEWYASYAARGGKTTLERYGGVLTNSDVSFQIQDGWLIEKPVDPQTASEQRMPRDVLQSFLEETMKQGMVTIDTAADLRAALPQKAEVTLASSGVITLLGQLAATPLNGFDPNILRFVGTLSYKEREAAASDTLNLDFSSLSKDQQDTLSAYVFGPNTYLSEVKPQRGSQIQSMDKTDVLPNGITPDSKVTVTDRTENVVYRTVQNAGGYSYSYGVDLGEIAYTLAQAQRPDVFKNYSQETVTGWKLGKKRNMTVTVIIGGKYTVSDDLSEDHPAKGQDVSLDAILKQLSADDRAKIDKQLQSILTSLQQRIPQSGAQNTGGAPPP